MRRVSVIVMTNGSDRVCGRVHMNIRIIFRVRVRFSVGVRVAVRVMSTMIVSVNASGSAMSSVRRSCIFPVLLAL